MLFNSYTNDNFYLKTHTNAFIETMSTQIDFRTLPANVPVLCIPRVYPNISEARIRRIFEDLNMGTLERIDIVSKPTDKGDKFNRVFVHYRRWNDSENARITRERLLNGKEIKIIYDEPWFWKISAYREAERKHVDRKPPADKPPSSQHNSASILFDVEDNARPPRDVRRNDTPKPAPRRYDDQPRRYDDQPRRYDDQPRRYDDQPRRYNDQPRRYNDNKPRDTTPVKRDDSRERSVPPVASIPAVDYGATPIPPPLRKRNYGEKRTLLKVEEAVTLEVDSVEVEDGEIVE